MIIYNNNIKMIIVIIIYNDNTKIVTIISNLSE
mgnify:CR=1 FL=1